MGAMYAGILGTLACATVLARGILRSSAADEVLWQGWLALWGFAILGWLAGQAAELLITDSVRAQLAEEVHQHGAERPRVS